MTKSHWMTLCTVVMMAVAPFSHRAAALSAAQASGNVIKVTIDVKPGDNPTTLEPKREGMVPIAILSSKEFDANRVDPGSVRAGATGSEASLFKSMFEDVDHDGDTDMILLFRVPDLRLSCSNKAVVLKGKTDQGRDFEGSETVVMTSC